MNEPLHRGHWGSTIGFVLAASGSAIGLGNLWKFPYVMGQNGGVWFLLAYLVFVVVMGVPIMLTEMAIGRASHRNVVGAFAAQDRRMIPVGVMGLLAAFVILSYYSVIGGWVLKYGASYLVSGAEPGFGDFIRRWDEPLLWHALFMVLTALICWNGVNRGIERAARVMMPALFAMLAILALRAMTLPGSGGGLRFMFSPSATRFTLASIPAALGQVFFSLSLGMGAMITYGSYLRPSARMVRKSVIIPVLDSGCALLAGLAIFPAVFAFGMSPETGPSLVFVTLPQVFAAVPVAGRALAILFFVLLAFAALTSAISLLECVVSFTIDEWHWRRGTSLALVGTTIFLLGIPSSLSQGALADWKPALFGGRNIFDAMCFLSDNLLMPLGGLLTCLFIGWIQGPRVMGDEIANHGQWPFRQYRAWAFVLRYLAPVLLVVVLLAQFGVWRSAG